MSESKGLNASEHFEILAALYYDRYRRLAPGKSEPIETGRSSGDDDNRRQWQRFLIEHALNDAVTKIHAQEKFKDAIIDNANMDYEQAQNQLAQLSARNLRLAELLQDVLPMIEVMSTGYHRGLSAKIREELEKP